MKALPVSQAIAHAELIRERLLAKPLPNEIATPVNLCQIDILVDRQKDIVAEVAKATGKATGTLIVILYDGFATLDSNAGRPRLGHRYNIAVWSKPILARDNLPADAVLESIINRMWHWIPDGGHCHGEVQSGDGGMVPDPKYLIYDYEIIIPVSH